MELNGIERDAILELFNIAMGQAASALSQMVDEEVLLSVPTLELLPRNKAIDHLGCSPDQRICAVRESFSGPFEGQAMLIFPEHSSLELVHRLLADSPPLASMTELEEEALIEIGNIVLNHCLASCADLLQAEINTDLPVYQAGYPGEVIGGNRRDQDCDHVLVIRIDFRLASQSIHGYVLLIQDIASNRAFAEAIRNFLSVNGL